MVKQIQTKQPDLLVKDVMYTKVSSKVYIWLPDEMCSFCPEALGIKGCYARRDTGLRTNFCYGHLDSDSRLGCIKVLPRGHDY